MGVNLSFHTEGGTLPDGLWE